MPARQTRRGGDEHEAYERASRTATKARTKIRPTHDDAVPGFVIGVDRGRYTLLLGENLPDERTVIAMKARELARDRVVVGDRVAVVGDVSGAKDTLARIVRIAERTSVLRRTADDTDPYERIIVTNADQLVIVTALANPEPRTGMIDRAVVAAYDAGVSVLLCLTKADLAPADELRGLYEPLGVDVVVTATLSDPASVEAVRERLSGRISVLLGHSGVGKSTLVNALVPGAGRATGHVNDVTGRGRHTSTSVMALRLPSAMRDASSTTTGGWVIDTPGVRSLGLAHVEIDNLLRAFDDLDDAAEECPRGCTHLADSPDCALDDWLSATVDPDLRAARMVRLDSFRRLLASRTAMVAP
ncbi:MAG: ribosome small subunit-dependent GTPase A [Promicromonosporaceae bacterium]|nr:ribosome small subunit-dependent GTPase A [Promicromonosporaceae bacterium]